MLHYDGWPVQQMHMLAASTNQAAASWLRSPMLFKHNNAGYCETGYMSFHLEVLIVTRMCMQSDHMPQVTQCAWAMC